LSQLLFTYFFIKNQVKFWLPRGKDEPHAPIEQPCRLAGKLASQIPKADAYWMVTAEKYWR
jgi:hypothetical protein